jgi:hypothetical protein
MENDTRYRVTELVFDSFDDAIWSAKRSRARSEHPFIEAAFPGANVITSVVRSASTRLGQKIMTQAAVDIARGAGRHLLNRTEVEVAMTESGQSALRKVQQRLRGNEQAPNFRSEIEELKEAVNEPEIDTEPNRYRSLRCDLRFEDEEGERYWVQLASPKMSQRKIEELHREALLLRIAEPEDRFVVGVYYAVSKSGRHRRSGLNYLPRYFQNIDELEESGRGTLEKIISGGAAPCVLIGEPFWNWLGASNETYEELIDIFRDAGEALHEEHPELLGGNSTE